MRTGTTFTRRICRQSITFLFLLFPLYLPAQIEHVPDREVIRDEKIAVIRTRLTGEEGMFGTFEDALAQVDSFDLEGRRVAGLNPLMKTGDFYYSWTEEGKIAEEREVEIHGRDTMTRRTTYEYGPATPGDTVSRLLRERRTLNSTLRNDTVLYLYSYDEQGRLIRKENRTQGFEDIYTWQDSLLVSERHGPSRTREFRDLSSTKYAYDSLGRRIETLISLGSQFSRRTTWEYDLEGRVVVERNYFREDRPPLEVRTLYDDDGRIARETVVDGHGEVITTATYTYDERGLLTRLDATGATGTTHTTYHYTTRGNVK